jgi:hypothetical protein
MRKYSDRMRSLGYRLLVCAALALLIASTASARAPSHAAFVTRADSICATENAQANALPAPTTQASTATYLAKTIVIIQRARTATLELPAPKADLPLIRAEMNDLAKELTFFRKAKADVVANDPASYQADVGQAKVFHDAGVAYAKKLGLKSCQA